MKRSFLGIDGGLAKLGYALINFSHGESYSLRECGVIVTKKSNKKLNINSTSDSIRRLSEQIDKLDKIIVPELDVVCIESFSYPRSSSAAAKYSMSYGMVICLCRIKGVPVVTRPPMTVKEACTGNKRASKNDMIKAMENKFGYIDWTGIVSGNREHAADAMGVVFASLDSEIIRWMRK